MKLNSIFSTVVPAAQTRPAAQGGPNLVRAASGVLTLAGVPVAGKIVTIGTTVYTWQAAPNSAYEVLIGVSAAASATNLAAAIEGNVLCVEHPDVSAVADGDTVVVTAKVAGPLGNDIVTTEDGANYSWASATLVGGSEKATPAQLLQLCVVGDGANKVNYIAVQIAPPIWSLVGPAGVIEDPNNIGEFLEITTDGFGALGYQSFDIVTP